MTDEEFDKLWTSREWRQEIDKLRAIVEAVAPIIKRNAELEAELAQLREQKPALHWNGKNSTMPHDDIGYLPNWTDYYPIPLYAEPKPAQIPSELVEWANDKDGFVAPWESYDAARAFVREQLDKMKG